MTTRVEHIGNATLYLGDCREILPTLGKVDAVITDPPYGIGYSHGVGGGNLARSTQFDHHPIVGDDEPFDPAPWLGFKTVVLFGANHYADKLPPSPFWLVWDKRDGVCSNDQADCEFAWVKGRGNARVIRHLWNGMLKASERGQPRLHPTQKPITVMRWVIEQCKLPSGSTILDPFMGSGTTGIAALKDGYRFIGIEIDPAHYVTAVRRLCEVHRQPDFFVDTRSSGAEGRQSSLLPNTAAGDVKA